MTQRPVPPLTPEQAALVESTLALVDQIIRRRFRGAARRFGMDELKSVGLEALCHAARTFSDDVGTPFGGYAFYRIRGAIMRAIKKESRAQELTTDQLVGAALEAGQTFGEAVEDEGAIDDTPEQSAHKADALCAGMLATMTIGAFTAAARLASESSWAQSAEFKQAKEIVHEVVAELPMRDRQIIERHHFGGELLMNIASDMRVSNSSIRRYHNAAMSRLGMRLCARGVGGVSP